MFNRSFVRRSTIAVVTAAVVLGTAGCAGSAGGGNGAGASDDSTFTLRFGTSAPETGQGSTTIKRWAESIEEESDGRITVDISWGGERVPASDLLAATQDGRLDAAHLAPVFWPAEMPLGQIVGIPFQTRDPEGQAQALWQTSQQSPYADEWVANGLEPQFNTPQGTTVIEFADAAPTSADELAGLRVRAVGNLALAISAAGGEPIAMDPGELYESLDRGVLDGAVFTFDGAPAFSLPEVAPITVDAGLGNFAAIIVAVTSEFMESLPEDLRGVVESASSEAREMATADLEASIAEHCEYFKEQDAEFVTWSSDATDEWSDLLGDAAVDAWLDVVESAGIDRGTAEQFRSDYLSIYDEVAGNGPASSDVASCGGA